MAWREVLLRVMVNDEIAVDTKIGTALATVQAVKYVEFLPEPSVLLIGNPMDGLSVVGPFYDADLAGEYAEDQQGESEWWAAVMLPPQQEPKVDVNVSATKHEPEW